jgi:hypothetical protein
VSVFVIDCTATGAPPPTCTFPILTALVSLIRFQVSDFKFQV